MAERGQQTEKPTPKRLEKARREGNFPAAREMVSALQFLAFAAMLAGWGAGWMAQMRQTMRWLLARAFRSGVSDVDVVRWAADISRRVGLPLGLAGGLLLGLTLAVQLAATQMGVSLRKAAPDFKRLNPLRKLRELPRQNLPSLVQAAVLIPLFGYAVYGIARDNYEAFFLLPLAGVEIGAGQLGTSILRLLWKAAAVFLVFGAVDLVRQKRRYQQDLRMSRQEVRDEAKDSEGNPHIKQRIRRLQRDMLRRQMMKEIPTATAVIMNPTHYAVALRYRSDSMAAPVVVAKGKNYLALRIRAKAVYHQVPVIENALLAQALYRSASVGQEIPAHLYRAVAEILAYLYRLMHRRLPGMA
ncbi:MAG: EscU/YscU/HrcU family type III secretion system export apparatus switch protein [Acidobacteriia bacterium]|nr:EscU/YscU/HrcU family type III secretion system export apparatus switch protein [Terriglobia bacterium]